MHTATAFAEPVTIDFGRALRSFRTARKLSQLELATYADISQRHLSFLESSRARPSREMVAQLAETLELPLRDRNRLLVAAGFAAMYPRRDLRAEDMAPVRQALDLLLHHHEPFPAMVVDRWWNLFMTNEAGSRFLGLLGDEEAVWRAVCPDGIRNTLKLTFHPQGLRPYIVNLPEVAPGLIVRLQREALEDAQSALLLETVLGYPGIPSRWKGGQLQARLSPVLPIHLRAHGMEMRLFTMLSTFGTPQDVTTDDLRVEFFFPADAASERLLRDLAAA